MRALVIDPSRSYRKLLLKLLGTLHVDAQEAEGVADAWKILDQGAVDLVCMAMSLADGDSAAFCLKIHTRRDMASVPILMLTSSENQQTARRCLAAGVTELFRKQEFEAFGAYVGRMVATMGRGEKVHGVILYLEDSRAMATVTIRSLTKAGFSVDHYTRAEDGIAAFEQKEFDLVLTDITLEGTLSGLDMLKAVRVHGDLTKRMVPVVAISSSEDVEQRLMLFRAGVNDYVPKPVLEEELLSRVSNLVSNRRMLASLASTHERLQKLAMTDQLTGLNNRHYLEEEAPLRIKAARRSRRPLCLMVLDIDHFKAINDKHGHHTGDGVIEAVGRLLRDSATEDDVAARIGGEEMVMLMGNCDLGTAAARAEQLRKTLMALNPVSVPVTASFGVAQLNPNEDYDAVFVRTDTAVYAAKCAGRNRVEIAAAS